MALSGCANLPGVGRLFSSTPVLPPDEAVELPYRVRKEDELQIEILGLSRLNQTVRVRPEGTFPFEPIGEVEAAGLSLTEVELELQRRLTAYFAEARTADPPIEDLPKRVIRPEEVTAETYRLRPGDQLDIVVWKHADLNQKERVREDGSFPFPLIGEVPAAGWTVREVEKEIQERLAKDYIVNPQVTARLSDARFTVLGEVTNPGSFVARGQIDVLAALSSAGGATVEGTAQVDIVRSTQKERVIIRVDPEKVVQGRQPRIEIFPHDLIYVREKPPDVIQAKVRLAGARYTVLGEVRSPGSYEIQGDVDLLAAVSRAGGITKFGSSRVEIIRGEGENRVVILADLDRVIRGSQPNVTIQPRDTIFVKRRLL